MNWSNLDWFEHVLATPPRLRMSYFMWNLGTPSLRHALDGTPDGVWIDVWIDA